MLAWFFRSRPTQAPAQGDGSLSALPPAQKLARLAIFAGLYALIAGAAWQLSAAVFTVGFSVLVLLVLCELYTLVALRSRMLRVVGMVASVLLLVRPVAWPALPGTLILSLTWLGGFTLLSLSTARPHRRELYDLLMMICGVFSVTLTLGQLVAIRALAAGRPCVVLVVATVAARESGAALGGLVFPGAPTINLVVSPRKNYAGWLVGATASLVTALVVRQVLDLAMTIGQAAVFGLCLGAACQLGDLSESYLKRMVRRRHSSNALGPEGGLLDTTDALAFGAVVASGLLHLWGA